MFEKIKPVKLIPIKSMKRLHFGLDTDRDKSPDWRDCRPFDPRRQHITPSQTMRKRLGNLPIYMTDKPIGEGRAPVGYHVATKAARKEAPEATRKFYATIKKYPSVVGDIERTRPEKGVFFSSVSGQPGERDGNIIGWQGEKTVTVRPPTPVYEMSKEEYYKKYQLDEREEVPAIFPCEEVAAEVEARSRKLQAMALHHELMHARQEKRFGEDLSGELNRFYSYEDKPTEIEARVAASREMAKYETVPSKKEVREWFKGIDEEE